jgi:hypothetical protein
MFKLYLRNPKTLAMETSLVETCAEAEQQVLAAWPAARVNPNGEVIVFRDKQTNLRGEPHSSLMPMVVARIEFQDKK